MYSRMAAFCVGVIIVYGSGTLLPWPIPVAFLILCLTIPKSNLSPLLFWGIFGYGYAASVATSHLEQILPTELEGVALETSGYICSLARSQIHYTQVEFCALALGDPASQVELPEPRRLILRWPNELTVDLAQATHVFKVKLNRPHGTANPIGPSYQQALFQQRICATGTIIRELPHAPIVLTLKQHWHRALVQLRTQLTAELNQQLLSLEHAGLLQALILGDQQGISAPDSIILAQTGTQHLLSISGLHVGVILLLLYHLLPKTRLWLVVNAVLGLGYVALVGFSTPAQRAWVMCVMTLGAMAGVRKSGFLRPFLLGLTAVLVLDPLAPLSMGFWFSFLCVAVLLLIVWLKASLRAPWADLLLLQSVLMIGLAPLNSYYGLPFSWSNGLANLVAIPWVSLVVLPGALLSSLIACVQPDLGQTGFVVLNEILHLLMTFLDSLQLIRVQLKAESRPVLVLALTFTLLGGLVCYRFKALALSLVLSLLLYFAYPSRFADNADRFVVFDAGQGLATLLQIVDQVWLYDTGPEYEKSSVAQRVIAPYLYGHNVTAPLAGTVISHGDLDHAGGLGQLLPEFQPSQVWAGEQERLPSVFPMQDCVRGMHWSSGIAQLEVLYPPAGLAIETSNNHSCVVRVQIGKSTILLTGDLDIAGEKYLIKLDAQDLSADILIAGHHGSNSSTSYALLKRVKPKIVIFSAGYRNRFGHPHPQVLERVKSFGAQIYNTADTGAVTFLLDRVDGSIKQVTTARNADSPFWLTLDGPDGH